MIVVDTNTWADYLNGRATPHVERLDAARLYRSMRRRGMTVHEAIDAQAVLLSPDSDFRYIARHSRLQLWQPPA